MRISDWSSDVCSSDLQIVDDDGETAALYADQPTPRVDHGLCVGDAVEIAGRRLGRPVAGRRITGQDGSVRPRGDGRLSRAGGDILDVCWHQMAFRLV